MKPFKGAAAPFTKGGARKPPEGSPAEEATETAAQETAEKRAGADVPKGGPAASLTAAHRRVLAKTGAAMADGSFPVRNRTDLRDAIHAVGRAHPDRRPAVKAHIVKRARALGATSHLPPHWMKGGKK